MRSTLVAKRLYAHTAGIAANRPIAVAISASEMPGATLAMVASLTLARPWNEIMMPHTVPNRPTYGLIEPTLARNSRLRSSPSSSREVDTRIARCAPSSWIRPSTPRRSRMRLNSRKPLSKIASSPPESRPRPCAPAYSFDRSAPDQNRSSKRSASSSARLSRLRLRKMITHEAIEATSSSNITNCTGIEACRISCTMSRWLPAAAAALPATVGSAASSVAVAAASSGKGSTEVACSSANRGVMDGLRCRDGGQRWRSPRAGNRALVGRVACDGLCGCTLSWSLRALFEGLEFFVQRFGDAARAEAGGVQCRDLDLRVEQQATVAADVLRDHQARAPALAQRDRHVQRVVQPRRRAEIDPHRPHREHQAVVDPQRLLSVTKRAQPFGPRAFEERQVLRVVDHATGVGIFP